MILSATHGVKLNMGFGPGTADLPAKETSTVDPLGLKSGSSGKIGAIEKLNMGVGPTFQSVISDPSDGSNKLQNLSHILFQQPQIGTF